MAKSGVHRLIVEDITLSKLRGPALIKALGKMNSSAPQSEKELSKNMKKTKSNKK